MILKTLFSLVFAAAVAGVGIRLTNAPHTSVTTAIEAPAVTPTPTAAPFSHPLLFSPVNTNANVSIGIDEACVQIFDGPCTNMWTYGGTLPWVNSS